MLHQCLPDVLGAARFESARRREQRANQYLVPAHHVCRHLPGAHAPAAPPRGTRVSASARRRMSSTSSGKGRVAALGRATTTISISTAICSRTCRYASRIRRRARLRCAAPRSCRLTAKPTRRRSAGRQSATKLGRSYRLPRWKIAWNSAARRRRSPRGSADAARAFATVCRLDGEALASLCAPPLQDLAPALSLHPRAKSVRLLATAHIGLKRPLHGNSPLGGRTSVVYGPPPTKSRYVRALRPRTPLWYGRLPHAGEARGAAL